VAERRLVVQLRQAAPIPLDLDFACEPNDVLAIFGASGSGKTTVLRSIAGLYRPAQTLVRSGQETWAESATNHSAPPHRRRVGFVFQDYALFPHLTAAGNIRTALGHLPRAQRQARAEQLLEVVHLRDRAKRQPRELSGGERQRVALARALAREPAVLLLDEPFAALDRAVRRSLQDQIDELRRSLDIPVVLVTHDLDDVVRLATHVLILERGRAVAQGTLEEVMSRPDLSWLNQAVGLGSVFDARVTARPVGHALVELAFDGGMLLVPHGSTVETPGTLVRVRIPARDVILASAPPTGLSLHNALTGTVTSITIDAAGAHAVVQLRIGHTLLLAEVTRDAVDRLGLAAGRAAYALIKSVSIGIAGPAPSLDRHE
jgi:molybdate transport system ATP-binding protein